MIDLKTTAKLFGRLFAVAALAASPAVVADSGPFIGASIGNATVSADIPDPGFGNDINFDEDDFAWKVYGGFAFDLPLIDLGVELGYFNLGSPSFDSGAGDLSIDVSGYSAFGLAGVSLGPVGLFLKGGYASWDADIQLDNLKGSQDGSDPAYGLGLRFTLGSLEVRGEYEVIDVDDVDDVYMASLGLAWRF
jgi:hypothetical protein